MDPTSFTQTSFCGSTVDNITTNESKGYILNHMSIMCSGKTYQSKYAKLFNERFSKTGYVYLGASFESSTFIRKSEKFEF